MRDIRPSGSALYLRPQEALARPALAAASPAPSFFTSPTSRRPHFAGLLRDAGEDRGGRRDAGEEETAQPAPCYAALPRDVGKEDTTALRRPAR
ncbi:hypothetical protein D1007_01344 [Hordeum vulgare]|nr:hypothetical protein D1007_01344 [Hordeum vulgare]